MSKGKPEEVRFLFETTDIRIPKLIDLQLFISSPNYLLVMLVQIFGKLHYFYDESYIILFSCLIQMHQKATSPLY